MERIVSLLIFGVISFTGLSISTSFAAVQTFNNSNRVTFDSSFSNNPALINESFADYVGGLYDLLCDPLNSACTSASLPGQTAYFANGIAEGVSITAFHGDNKGLGIVGAPGQLINLSDSMLISPDKPGNGLDFVFDKPLSAFGFEAFNHHQSSQTLLIRAFDDAGNELGEFSGMLSAFQGVPETGDFFGLSSDQGNISQVNVISTSFRAPTLYMSNMAVLPVPETSVWIMMLMGLGVTGVVLRRQNKL